MRIVVLDAHTTPGLGAAHFSKAVVAYLQTQGHTVQVISDFEARLCADADVVWNEWCDELAIVASRSGICRRLVLRMRGYESWHIPLNEISWSNVHALTYESVYLRELAESRFPFLHLLPRCVVLPAGVDLTRFTWKPRGPGNVVAMAARIDPMKGYQLMLEWARQRPDLAFHVTTAVAQHAPRFLAYVKHARPANVHLHETVDTARWLNDIDANFLLQPSAYESFGYVVAEAMALGVKPLIHDCPSARRLWPEDLIWRSLDDLDKVQAGAYESERYRAFVEDKLDAARLSPQFAALLLDGLNEDAAVSCNEHVLIMREFDAAEALIHAGALAPAAKAVEDFRAEVALVHERAWLAVHLAVAYYNQKDIENARLWATRALADGPRVDAMCLLGEIAAIGMQFYTSHAWYEAACALPPLPCTYIASKLLDAAPARLQEARAFTVAGRGPAIERLSVPAESCAARASTDGFSLMLEWYDEPDEARRAEYARALALNLAHSQIASVWVHGAAEALARLPQHAKLRKVPTATRMTFARFFAFASDVLRDKLCILANADVYFDDTLARLPDPGARVVALTRWDPQSNGPPVFVGNPVSQDVWIFRAPLRVPGADFFLGLIGCDCRLSYLLCECRRTLWNPSLDIRALHLHTSEKRNYDPMCTVPRPHAAVPFVRLVPEADATVVPLTAARAQRVFINKLRGEQPFTFMLLNDRELRLMRTCGLALYAFLGLPSVYIGRSEGDSIWAFDVLLRDYGTRPQFVPADVLRDSAFAPALRAEFELSKRRRIVLGAGSPPRSLTLREIDKYVDVGECAGDRVECALQAAFPVQPGDIVLSAAGFFGRTVVCELLRREPDLTCLDVEDFTSPLL